MNTPLKKETQSETKKRKYDQITKLINEFNALATPSGRRIKVVEEIREKPNTLQMMMDQARLRASANAGGKHRKAHVDEEEKEQEILASKENISSSDTEADFLDSDNDDWIGDMETETDTKHYRAYSFDFKKEVMNFYIKNGETLTLFHYKIPEGTLKSWISKFNKEGWDGFKDKRVSNQRPHDKKLDETLVNWIKELRSLSLPVTGISIRCKAKSLVNSSGFKAGSSWLDAFLKRNKLSRRRRTHEVKKLQASFDNEVKEYFTKLEEIRKKDQEILYINFDEVPFVYDMMSDYTIHSKGEKRVELLTNNKAKVRMTVGLSITSEGQHLSPLIVSIYKQKMKKSKMG
jgi:transposase